jgi:transposase-like protein
VFFCVVAHNADNFPRCGQQRRKMIGLLPTQVKNYRRCCQQRRNMFQFEYLHKFETMCSI